jgi:hypothetical protein
MTLATIPKRPKFVRGDPGDFSLRTDDIDGARAKTSPFKTRDHALNISDIEGTHATPMFNPNSTPIDVMKVRDIDGSTPRICRNLPHSSRHTNPLNPEYQLPTKEEVPPPEIPFIYDGINFDDIPGVHPKSYKTDKPPRDIMKTSDIPGASARRLVGTADRDNRSLDVRDINGNGRFRTRRSTNPLNPQYVFDGGVLKDDFGVASSNYGTRREPLDISLTTSDIEGAAVTRYADKYRRRRQEDVEPDTTLPLMLPSMYKQTAELQRQKEINQVRGERIRRFESRHLGAKRAPRSTTPATSRIQPRADPITL